jgi:hypothetical protein
MFFFIKKICYFFLLILNFFQNLILKPIFFLFKNFFFILINVLILLNYLIEIILKLILKLFQLNNLIKLVYIFFYFKIQNFIFKNFYFKNFIEKNNKIVYRISENKNLNKKLFFNVNLIYFYKSNTFF